MKVFFWLLVFGILAIRIPIGAEQGVLVVHVKDLHDRPISGVRLRAGADSAISPPTAAPVRPRATDTQHGARHLPDNFGQTRIRLASETKAGDVVMLQIVDSERDLVMVSPWDKWIHVPPFDNEAKNFVPIVLVERGDKACLENPACIRAATAQILKLNDPGAQQNDPLRREDRKQDLDEVANRFGLEPHNVDEAIRAWGTKADDPYEKGLAALYERHYPEATDYLMTSFEKRKRSEAKAQQDVADAAFFLGKSLYQQGRYRESAEKYQEVFDRRPEDPVALNNLGLSLYQAGDYERAEPLFRFALALDQAALGMEHASVATELNNLALLLLAKGDYGEAEPLFRRALAIREKAVGTIHADVATDLNNLGLLLHAKGDSKSAELLLWRALTLFAMTVGASHPDVGTNFNNLAALLHDMEDSAKAEPLYRLALTIHEKALGPDHPRVATDLNNLALLLHNVGSLEAEPLLRRALAIHEKALGSQHPEVATDLSNLALMLVYQGRSRDAEPLLRRALEIDERALGPNHSDVGRDLNNLALLLYGEANYAKAEPLYRRALAIFTKTLGPDHQNTRTVLDNLGELQQLSKERSR